MPSVQAIQKAANAAKYGPGFLGLWKRGWDQIPEVMGSSIFGLIGFILVGYAGIREYNTENRTKRFKAYYTIFRPEDKATNSLQKHIHDNSPKPTSTPTDLIKTKTLMTNKTVSQCLQPEFKF